MLDDGGRLRSCWFWQREVSGDQGWRREGRVQSRRGQQGRRFSRGGADSGRDDGDERASPAQLWLQKRGGRLCLMRCGKAGLGLGGWREA